MTYRKYTVKSKQAIVFTLLVIVIAVVVTVAVVIRSRVQAVPVTDNSRMQPISKFSFNSSSAAGWRQGPSNTTSMALFSNDRSCFVSAEYRNGSVDIDAELQKSQETLSGDGYARIALNEIVTEMQVGTGKKSYSLYQYQVSSNSGTSDLYGGQEFGYIPLGGGYIFVMGHCNSAEQLSTTMPALQAISFRE